MSSAILANPVSVTRQGVSSYLWEADGRPEGREQEYWEQAEAMVRKEESEE